MLTTTEIDQHNTCYMNKDDNKTTVNDAQIYLFSDGRSKVKRKLGFHVILLYTLLFLPRQNGIESAQMMYQSMKIRLVSINQVMKKYLKNIPQTT